MVGKHPILKTFGIIEDEVLSQMTTAMEKTNHTRINTHVVVRKVAQVARVKGEVTIMGESREQNPAWQCATRHILDAKGG